jgi:ABC-2 type transport system ATP-binding protein
VIDIQSLSFSYRRESLFHALTVRLEPGNVYGLLGVNGAGKSTLLKLITGLLFGNSGSIRSLGRDPAQREPGYLAEVFLLPEELAITNITGSEYLARRAPFYPRFDHGRFARYLTEFDVSKDRRLSALSLGQQKKFLLAFGLACGSSVVLLDEPTNGLDIPSKGQFRRVIAESVTPDRLFVISTHQVRDVGALIDPIVVLHRGEVLLNSSVAGIASAISMQRSSSPPDIRNPGFVYSEPTVGGFWSVWEGADGGDESLDLEVLFSALIAHPERCASLFRRNGARA